MEYIQIPQLNNQTELMNNYYQFQSQIYDMTRWSFLFGRKKVIRSLPILTTDAKDILEVGCGTGHNLILLANRFPNATIVGIDISEDMVEKARKATKMYPNIVIEHSPFPSVRQFDVVLFSYALTMMNPGWEFWITATTALLKPNGYLAIVDFHRSPFQWFAKHMSNHHVRMDAHLLPAFQNNFKTFNLEIRKAYFGLWHYLVFIGKTKANNQAY